MTWARDDQNGVVVEVVATDPTGRFHAGLVWYPCPAAARIGDRVLAGVVQPRTLAPPDLRSLRDALAAQRYQHETAGVAFQASTAKSPVVVASDPTSQAKLGNAYTLARDGFWVDGTPWKCADGSFVALTASDIKDLAKKVAAYVASCYAHEAQLAATLAANPATDITAGWPSSA